MNTTGWIILIVVIVVIVIAIIVVALTAGRRRKLEHDRQRAQELRADARDDDLAAREREAKAAQATADAKQAEVEAEQRRRSAEAHATEAAEARSSIDEKLAKADALDPDVRTDRNGNRVGDQRPDAPRTDTAHTDGARPVETPVNDANESPARHAEPRIDTGRDGTSDVPPPPAR
ncbi:hypothetical protein [Leifsonia aquatica]|uniref:FtsZ-interacting cell division protein ZipA n=2 Tax=Leifsonia aquatica TaxID=144185 RepID=A0A7W4UU56_LEIAQ|nr:hypothetical protein [Leifsonia aquatica]MBB2966281.1 FtsZ-interacting cell division protein ZipA [Leifsonia aquatica]